MKTIHHIRTQNKKQTPDKKPFQEEFEEWG